MAKILSLCIPTYNRDWCVKQQIERLEHCSSSLFEKLEIIISDNCSTDNTQQIVEEAISRGFPCRYSRNEVNLGMDGNFVSCFRMAKAKYVWLLGDDDWITIDSLEKIVSFLDCDIDYGLVHINVRKRNGDDFIIYDNDDEYCRQVSYYFTFISSNIAQTKYVKDVQFEKYMGTWFTLIPLYFESLHREPKNVICNLPVFEGGKDAQRNGGYNLFQVFISNYLNLLKEFRSKKMISSNTYSYMKKNIFEEFLIYYIIRLLIHKEDTNFERNGGWAIVFRYYWVNMYFYITIGKRAFSSISRRLSF